MGKTKKSTTAKKNTGKKKTYHKPKHQSDALLTSKAMRTMVLPGNEIANPFPAIKYCTQKYSGTYNFSSGAAGVFGPEQVWGVNNLFDPDFSGVGHQPLGRDELAGLYNTYKVTSVDIDITFINNAAGNIAVGLQFVPAGQASALVGLTVDAANEKPNTIVKYTTDTGNQKVHFKYSVPMWKLAQVTKLQFDADRTVYSAPVGVSPAEPLYIRVAIADPAGGAVGAATAMTKLTFHAKWYNRKQLPQS